MEYLGFFIVFGSIVFLAYVTTKYIGNKAGKTLKGKYITIIETVSIGMDKQLHLVKVADQYLLIASSGKSIEFLTQVKLEGYQPEPSAETVGPVNFGAVLEKYVQNFKGDCRKATDLESQLGEQSSPGYSNAFSNNLNRLKNLTSRVDKGTGQDGDEKVDEL